MAHHRPFFSARLRASLKEKEKEANHRRTETTQINDTDEKSSTCSMEDDMLTSCTLLGPMNNNPFEDAQESSCSTAMDSKHRRQHHGSNKSQSYSGFFHFVGWDAFVFVLMFIFIASVVVGSWLIQVFSTTWYYYVSSFILLACGFLLFKYYHQQTDDDYDVLGCDYVKKRAIEQDDDETDSNIQNALRTWLTDRRTEEAKSNKRALVVVQKGYNDESTGSTHSNSFKYKPAEKSMRGFNLSLLMVLLMCSQVQVDAADLSWFGDNNGSSAPVPITIKPMKKPCVLYRVVFLKYLNQTNGVVETNEIGNRDASTWVCELDAEDRVSYIHLIPNSSPIKHLFSCVSSDSDVFF